MTTIGVLGLLREPMCLNVTLAGTSGSIEGSIGSVDCAHLFECVSSNGDRGRLSACHRVDGSHGPVRCRVPPDTIYGADWGGQDAEEWGDRAT